jgi:hypothetical protein
VIRTYLAELSPEVPTLHLVQSLIPQTVHEGLQVRIEVIRLNLLQTHNIPLCFFQLAHYYTPSIGPQEAPAVAVGVGLSCGVEFGEDVV